MRRVQTIADVQIVLNDILNRLGPLDSSLLDRHGYRITNIGAAEKDSDAVTLAQLNEKPNFKDLPTLADTHYTYTAVWDLQGTATVDDVIPAFCITEESRTGFPTRVWLACRTAGAADMSINIKYEVKEIKDADGNVIIHAVAAKYLMVDEHGDRSDLKLKAEGFGPVFTASFRVPAPFFQIGTRVFPEIFSASDNGSPSIGLVVTRNTTAALK